MRTYLCVCLILALALPVGATAYSSMSAVLPAAQALADISSALHVLPPLGQDAAGAATFDRSLLTYLRVSIWQVTGEQTYVEMAAFTSSKQQNGLDYLKLQGDHYHVNWNIAKEDAGKQLVVQFAVAGLNIGYIALTPATARTMPIMFRIENHPAIRARVLHEQGLGARAVSSALIREFNLGAGDIARVLSDEKFSVLQIGEVLRDVFGSSASAVAQLLADNCSASASEIAEVLTDLYAMRSNPSGVAQILKDAGFSASEIQAALKSVLGLDSATIISILKSLGFTIDELFAASSRALAEQFAPQLRFDHFADTFPMSAQEYFEKSIVGSAGRLENKDSSTLTTPGREPPTYFKAFQVGLQIRILYWWYYGYQPGCLFGAGGYHDGDWEHVMVTLSQDATKVVAVTYFQHSGQYTRLAQGGDLLPFVGADYGAGLEFDGQHPVVYVGNGQHGSYYDRGAGLLEDCFYFSDWRLNLGESSLWLNTARNLKSLADFEEPWMRDEATVTGASIGAGDGITTTFNLDSRYVLGGTVVVKVNGVVVPSTGVQFSDGTGANSFDQVIFSTAPASGAVITGDWEKGDFKWGCGPCREGGISTHPIKRSVSSEVVSTDACSGMNTTIFYDAGCFASQCEYHDNQSWLTDFYPGTCSHCPAGYTDWGTFCGKGTWPWEWRTTSIHYYGLDYALSQTDAGLSTKR